jgi:predicted enzyme related to lactoylglutathione lyase
LSGRVVHFEIPFDDGDRARGFYAGVFGWEAAPMPGLDYTMVSTGPSDPETGPTEPGFINGGMFQRAEGFTGPNLVVDVDNLEDVLGKVAANGGTVVSERQAVGDMGFTAYFRDSEGNLVGLWETATG